MSINSIISNPIILAELAGAIVPSPVDWEQIPLEYDALVLKDALGANITTTGSFKLFKLGQAMKLVSIGEPAAAGDTELAPAGISHTYVSSTTRGLVAQATSLAIPAEYLPSYGVSLNFSCYYTVAAVACLAGVCSIQFSPVLLQAQTVVGQAVIGVIPAVQGAVAASFFSVAFPPTLVWELD